MEKVANSKDFSKIRINFKWEIIYPLLLFIMLLIIMAIIIQPDYEVHYIEYTVQEDDTLFNIVQEKNTSIPPGWDTYDLVFLSMKENKIDDVSQLQPGDIILVPVIKN